MELILYLFVGAAAGALLSFLLMRLLILRSGHRHLEKINYLDKQAGILEERINLLTREHDGILDIVITDSGPGIPDYAHDKVFGRFYSLPRPDDGPRSSGLGLSLVREVAQLHGGSISLNSRPEGGTEAVLSLPTTQHT